MLRRHEHLEHVLLMPTLCLELDSGSSYDGGKQSDKLI